MRGHHGCSCASTRPKEVVRHHLRRVRLNRRTVAPAALKAATLTLPDLTLTEGDTLTVELTHLKKP